MKKSYLFQFVSVVVALMGFVVMGISVKPASAAPATGPFLAYVSGTVSITGEASFALSGLSVSSRMGASMNYQANGTFTSPTTDILIETLTAANGDTLTIRCAQVLQEISPNVFRGTDTWTVIGGTGRFSGATGSGTGETIANLNTGTFTKQMIGNINY